MNIKISDMNEEQKKMVLNELLEFRLENYGYDYREFKNMSNRKSKIKSKINRNNPNWQGIIETGYNNRWDLHDNGGISYITGQSNNEEMIAMLECLLYKKNS